MRTLIALGLFVTWLLLWRWLRWRRYARVADTLRARYEARYDPTLHQAHLDELVRIVLSALGAEMLSRPEYVIPSDMDGDADRLLGDVARESAARFGIESAEVRSSFVPQTAIPDVAGCVVRRGGLGSISLDDTTAHVRPAPNDEPSTWHIEVADRYRSDPVVVATVVAHEMAHVALFSRGIRLVPRERNEELTDVAAILAGFGSVMLELTGREHLWTSSTGRLHLKVGGPCSLHREAVRYVNERRALVASEGAGGAAGAWA